MTQWQNVPWHVPGAGPNASNAKFQNKIINKVKDCGFLSCTMGYWDEILVNAA